MNTSKYLPHTSRSSHITRGTYRELPRLQLARLRIGTLWRYGKLRVLTNRLYRTVLTSDFPEHMGKDPPTPVLHCSTPCETGRLSGHTRIHTCPIRRTCNHRHTLPPSLPNGRLPLQGRTEIARQMLKASLFANV